MGQLLTLAVVLDSTPVGALTNPKNRTAYQEAHAWLDVLLSVGVSVFLSEIAHYQGLRELIHRGSQKGIRELRNLQDKVTYLPIQTPHVTQAAHFWGYGRQIGIMTASDDSWDADLILAAQARELESFGYTVIVATSNMRYLEHFVDARLWYYLTPATLDGK